MGFGFSEFRYGQEFREVIEVDELMTRVVTVTDWKGNDYRTLDFAVCKIDTTAWDSLTKGLHGNSTKRMIARIQGKEPKDLQPEKIEPQETIVYSSVDPQKTVPPRGFAPAAFAKMNEQQKTEYAHALIGAVHNIRINKKEIVAITTVDRALLGYVTMVGGNYAGVAVSTDETAGFGFYTQSGKEGIPSPLSRARTQRIGQLSPRAVAAIQRGNTPIKTPDEIQEVGPDGDPILPDPTLSPEEKAKYDREGNTGGVDPILPDPTIDS